MNRKSKEKKQQGLGQLSATAICGNDITSSCLYVSALSITFAGRWAPLTHVIVAAYVGLAFVAALAGVIRPRRRVAVCSAAVIGLFFLAFGLKVQRCGLGLS